VCISLEQVQEEEESRIMNVSLVSDGSPPDALFRSGRMFLDIDELTAHIYELDHGAPRSVARR